MLPGTCSLLSQVLFSLFVSFAELVPFSRLPLGSVLGGALRALTARILILLS